MGIKVCVCLMLASRPPPHLGDRTSSFCASVNRSRNTRRVEPRTILDLVMSTPQIIFDHAYHAKLLSSVAKLDYVPSARLQ
jgi:hypothetical protein